MENVLWYALGKFFGGFVFYLIPAWIVWPKDKEVRNALLILALIINAIYIFIAHEQYVPLVYFGLWVLLGAIAIRTPYKEDETMPSEEYEEDSENTTTEADYSLKRDTVNIAVTVRESRATSIFNAVLIILLLIIICLLMTFMAMS